MDVIGGGDYNSDGIDDFIITAPDDFGGLGSVFLLDGTQLAAADQADGVTDGIIDVREIPGLSNSYSLITYTDGNVVDLDFGRAADFGGQLTDLNPDGKADEIVIGARDADTGAGRVYVISGDTLATLDGNGDGRIVLTDGQLDVFNGYVRIDGVAGDDFGSTIVGDQITDPFAYSQLLIGAPGENGDAGALYVLGGGTLFNAAVSNGVVNTSELIDPSNGSVRIFSTEAGARLGDSVAAVENRDTSPFGPLNEVLIGAPGSGGDAGAAYLVDSAALGNAAFVDGIGDIDVAVIPSWANSYRFDGVAAGDQAGVGLAAGAIGGGSDIQIMIGAPGEDSAGTDAGAVYVISSDQLAALASGGVIDLGDIPGSTGSHVLLGNPNSALGYSLAAGEDYNADGIDDLLIGAPTMPDAFNAFGRGEAYALSGDALGSATNGAINIADIIGSWDDSYRLTLATQNEALGPGLGVNVGFAPDMDADGGAETLFMTSSTEVTEGFGYLLSFPDLDGGGSDGEIELPTLCLSDETRLRTQGGWTRAGDIRVGDLVDTADHGVQTVRWVSSQRLAPDDLRAHPRKRPVRIAAGALGPGLPSRELVVSPQHRMLLAGDLVRRWFGTDEVLAAAIHLTSLPGIERCLPKAGVTYVHILCDRHEIVFAEGAATETLLLRDGGYGTDIAMAHGLDADAANADLHGSPARRILTGPEARGIATALGRGLHPMEAVMPAA